MDNLPQHGGGNAVQITRHGGGCCSGTFPCPSGHDVFRAHGISESEVIAEFQKLNDFILSCHKKFFSLSGINPIAPFYMLYIYIILYYTITITK